MRAIAGGTPYAIGTLVSPRTFSIRCIRFGKLAASYERRHHEEIRAVKLIPAARKSRPEPLPKQEESRP